MKLSSHLACLNYNIKPQAVGSDAVHFDATYLSDRRSRLLIVLSLLMTACLARVGGQLGKLPLEGAVAGTFQGNAKFGFNFTCEVKNGKPVVRGQIEYQDKGSSELPRDDLRLGLLEFPPIAIHGEIKPVVFLNAEICENLPYELPGSALFEGRYRPKKYNLSMPLRLGEEGDFVVQVFDEGEPARQDAPFTGDGFAIELFGGRYHGYTRVPISPAATCK